MRDVRRSPHIPVLLQPVLEVLDPKPGQVFVDCTTGLGGHTAAILERLASLRPSLLACQHGSAYSGDGAALIRALAASLEPAGCVHH